MSNKSAYAGGIVAYGIDSVKIINCTSDVDCVKGTTSGGIVGRMQNSTANIDWCEIIGCFSYGNIEGLDVKDTFAGGIVGVAGATNIKYCGNFGDVVGGKCTNLGVAGGVIGCQGASDTTTHVYNCFNLGKVTGIATDDMVAKTYVGGILGRAAHIQDYINGARVENCFNANGNVTLLDESGNVRTEGNVGSLIGHIRYIAYVANCYVSVPTSELPDVALDDMGCVEAGNITVITDAQMKGADAVATMKLNEAWIAGSDYPTIDVAKALTVQDAPAEDTTPEETVPVEDPTDTEPVEIPEETEPVDVPEETEPVDVPAETTPADTEPADTTEPGGSKTIIYVAMGVIAVVAVVLIVIVVITEKKKAK